MEGVGAVTPRAAPAGLAGPTAKVSVVYR